MDYSKVSVGNHTFSVVAADPAFGPPAVTLTEDPASYTMANGIVTAKISKRSGDLTSLIYKGTELLASNSGHAGGYWSHDTTGGAGCDCALTWREAYEACAHRSNSSGRR